MLFEDIVGIWVGLQVYLGLTNLQYSGRLVRWQLLKTKSPSKFDSPTEKMINSGCKSTYEFHGQGFDGVEPKYPPQNTANPLQCAVVRWREPYNGAESLVYYVLLNNGELWMWNHSPDLRMGFELFIVCLLVGLISGILIWLRLQKRFS